jgi:tetratricopeptide (TPR) repeat protein
MKHSLEINLHKLLTTVALLSLLVSSAWSVQDFDAHKLLVASTQHDIIQVLLKDKNFEAVFPEMDKIFALGLPAEHEGKVVQEVRIITDAFLQNQRADLAIRALQKGIQSVAQPKNKAVLYQELGYVYRLQGNDLKALECFRRAQQLAEKLTTRPY